jgi:predicted nucleic acid-binding protein
MSVAEFIVVSDTSVITHLAKVNLLHLLHALFEVVYIPQAVLAELTYSDDTPGAVEVQSLSWIRREAVAPTAELISLGRMLGTGESEAIVLAIHKRADLLLMDERLGRAEATKRA